MFADVSSFFANLWSHLANLTTMQIVLGLVGGFVLLMLAKVIFTRGGPQQRMKGAMGPWIVVPVLVVALGGVVWVVIKVFAPTGGFHL